MHCSANVGQDGDVALFFGLSGTGKTTLSADPARDADRRRRARLEDDGVFNFEGGCYAKMIRLSTEAEPQIWHATSASARSSRTSSSILDARRPTSTMSSLTENTRAAYPLEFIDNASPTGTAGHPKNIVMLTADAFGVLPPIAKLTPSQAMYHFLSGYTAKVAGTESGLGNEPQADILDLLRRAVHAAPSSVYANLLRS